MMIINITQFGEINCEINCEKLNILFDEEYQYFKIKENLRLKKPNPGKVK